MSVIFEQITDIDCSDVIVKFNSWLLNDAATKYPQGKFHHTWMYSRRPIEDNNSN